MSHRDPTIRSRELGDGLRQAMESAGLTGKQAARTLGWSPSFISMLLTGKRDTSEVDIAAFLGACRVKDDDRVGARLARQNLFSRDRPTRFAFYLHEFALRLPVGGPTVMTSSWTTCCGCRDASI